MSRWFDLMVKTENIFDKMKRIAKETRAAAAAAAATAGKRDRISMSEDLYGQAFKLRTCLYTCEYVNAFVCSMFIHNICIKCTQNTHMNFERKQRQNIAQYCVTHGMGTSHQPNHPSTHYPASQPTDQFPKRIQSATAFNEFSHSVFFCLSRSLLLLSVVHSLVFFLSFFLFICIAFGMEWIEKLMKYIPLNSFYSRFMHHLKWRTYSQVHCRFRNKYFLQTDRMKYTPKWRRDEEKNHAQTHTYIAIATQKKIIHSNMHFDESGLMNLCTRICMYLCAWFLAFVFGNSS